MTDLDTGYHKRRLAQRMESPEFRREYELARAQIAQVDAIIRELDHLREEAGLPKAELARRIGKDPAAVRRLLTSEANPELKTIAAMAAALGAEVKVVPRRKRARHRSRAASPAGACCEGGWRDGGRRTRSKIRGEPVTERAKEHDLDDSAFQLIHEAVHRLVEAANPDKIILFGSFARGEGTKDSDLDFLVVLPTVTNRHAEMVRLARALAPLHVPVDVLVYSTREVEERGHLPGTALREALSEGRVLYGAP